MFKGRILQSSEKVIIYVKRKKKIYKAITCYVLYSLNVVTPAIDFDFAFISSVMRPTRLADPEPQIARDVDIILGVDETANFITGPMETYNNELITYKTPFGRVVSGQVPAEFLNR